MNLKPLSVLFLTATIILSMASCAKAPPKPVSVKEKGEVIKFNKKKPILDEEAANSKIELSEEKNKDGMPLSWTLKINGDNIVQLNAEEGLYSNAQFQTDDLDGDKKPEVLIYRHSSGSAGATDLQVYKLAKGSWASIFKLAKIDDQNNFDVKYLGDFQVSFRDKTNSLNATIGLAEKQYEDVKELLPNITTWVDPISDYLFQDLDNDTVKEIITIQRVIGISHADTIGLLKTGYKLKNGSYKPVNRKLYNSNNKLLSEISL